jgi:hypothetical protein
MTPKEALDKIKALFSDATPSVTSQNDTTSAALEAKEYVLKGGAKVLISDFEIGGMVSVMAEDGTSAPAPAGDHKLADGTTITVDEAGVITAIVVPEVAPEAPSAEEEMKAKIAQLESQVANFEAIVKSVQLEFISKVAQTESKLKEVGDIVVKLLEVPSAEPTQPVRNNFDSHMTQTRDQKIANFLEMAKNFKNK